MSVETRRSTKSRQRKSGGLLARQRRAAFELLEQRQLLSRSLYIDFGDYFPAAGLSTTVLQLRDTFANGGIQGPDFRGGTYTDATNLRFDSLNGLINFDYNGDGLTNGLDASALKADTLAVVQRIFAPFDVDVQIAPALDNSSSAAYRAGIASVLQASDLGSAWTFCSALIDVGTGNMVGSDKSSSGRAAGNDIGGDNLETNSAVVNADYMLQPAVIFNGIVPRNNAATALGDNIVHESGHTFGLQHIYDTNNPRTVTLANSEQMGYGLSWTQYGLFTRYPLLSDYQLANPNTQPGPAIIDYDRLADSDLLGVNPWASAYVTGTGAYDTISITASGANTALISVSTYSDAAHTVPLAVPGGNAVYVGNDGAVPTIYTANGNVFSYTVNTSNGILIDAGENDDWIVVDAGIAANVTVRGMSGVNRLEILGNGAVDGYYLPDSTVVPSLVTQNPNGSAAPTNLGGTVRVGSTNIYFQDYTSSGEVYVHNVGDFTYYTPNSEDTLAVDSPQAGRQRISGTSSGVGTVPLVFANLANLTIDTGYFDGSGGGAGSGDDSILLAGSGLALGLQSITINTGLGNDSVTIDSSSVLYNVANGIRYDGGSGFNTLILDQTGGATQVSDTYSVGPTPGEGSSVIVGAGGTQTVYFQNLAPVLDNVPAATAIVNATAASNAINYSQGPGGGIFGADTTGLVSVDNQETFEFSNKTSLVINGLAGSDEINLNNPTTPTGLTGNITINGGDPTASDILIVNGVVGSQDNLRHVPTNVGAGSVINDSVAQPQVNFTGIEHLKLVVQQADGDGIRLDGTTGNDLVQLTPGATADSGIFTGTMDSNNATGNGLFALTETTYQGVNSAANDQDVNFFNPGGTDQFVFNGTAFDDTINVGLGEAGGTEFRNTINGQVVARAEVFSVASARVRGLDGDDHFSHSAAVTVPVSYEGGDPSASDVLSLTGTTGSENITIDLAAGTITGLGGTVSFAGIEQVAIDGGGGTDTLLFTGTAGPDAITYTPTGTASGTLQIAGWNTVFSFAAIAGAFSIDAAGNSDTVSVVGTSGNDAITATGGATPTVQVGTWKAVGLVTANTESLQVLAGDGADGLTINSAVAPFLIPLVYDGGNGADTLTLSGGTASSDIYSVGPQVGAGTSTIVFTSGGGGTQLVNFLNVEPVLDLVVGPLVVVGTNADNAINYTQGSVAANGLVSVDGQETIEFSNKNTLTINALAGSDTINLNNQTKPTGLTGVTVVGGDPTGSDTLIVNGIAGGAPATRDELLVTPTGVGSGTIAESVTAGATAQANFVPLSFSGLEHLTVVGQAGELDQIASVGTAGNDTFEALPGGTPDAGDILGFVTGASAFAFVPVHYLGFLGLIVASVGLGGTDTLIVDGTSANDTFWFAATTPPGAVGGPFQTVQLTSGSQTYTPIIYDSAAVSQVIMRGLEGNDAFNVNLSSTTGNLAVAVRVEGGSGSNTLNYTAPAGAATTIDYGAASITSAGPAANPVYFAGIATINETASLAGSSLTINGTSAPDSLSYTPTGATAGTVALAGNYPLITFTGVGGTFTIDAGGLSDTVTVNGTSGNDAGAGAINLVRGVTTTVQVGTFKTVSLPTANTESLIVAAGLGDDVINISGSGGPASVTVDGGLPSASDVLNIVTGANAAVDVTFGAELSTGVVSDNVSGNVSFQGVETLGLTGSGANTTLTVNGTNGDDAINQSANNVTVNNGPVVAFNAYPTLTLRGLAGDDTISVKPITLVGTLAMNVDGGDPTASDTVIVDGTSGVDAVTIDQLTADGARVIGLGTPLTITTAERLIYSGGGGNDSLTVTTPSGSDQISFTPGVNAGQASLAIQRTGGGTLLPINYVGIGSNGSLTLADAAPARSDSLTFLGTAVNDRFDVSAAGGIRLFDTSASPANVTLLVSTPGIRDLTLAGLNGDDIFNIPANHPFPGVGGVGIVIEGGEPSASDVVNFTGSATLVNAITVDLQAATVAEATFAAVMLSGVELLNVNAAGHNLQVQATTGDDRLSVTPNGVSSASVQLDSSSPAISGVPIVNGTNIATFSVDLLGGNDHLVVNGTQTADTITVTGTSVLVNPGVALVTVNYLGAEFVQVNALAGNDTVNVTPSAGSSIFVDGGDPIGSTPGDQINLFPPGAFSIEAGPENDEGGLNAAGVQRVSWDHIEGVTISGGGPGLVLGTNGDDDITIIARDASYNVAADGVRDFTVSVNDGPNILFVNVADLFVDALAGDDDIVVREPAPNNAVWNVNVTIAGGPPAAPMGESGDVFELETPGAQTVIYTPTGIDTATLNDVTNASLITLTASFTIPAIPYTSSPGGIEKVIFDGQAGNDNLTIQGTANDDSFVHTPGVLNNSGTFSIGELLGLSYQNLAAGSVLTVDGLGGTNSLTAVGTTANDAFRVDATTGTVRLNSRLPIAATAIQNLQLVGLTGDDTFNVQGALPFTTTTIDGDEPSASDIINLTGATGLVTVNLADSTLPTDTTITGYGGVIVLTGVEVANLDAAGFGMTVNGTAQDDAITYTPTGASAGTFQLDGLNTRFNFTTVTGTFLVTGGVGAAGTVGNTDTLIVRGTTSRDLFQIDQGARTVQVLVFNVNPLKTVTLDPNIQVLSALGLSGQDTFQVAQAAGVPAYVGDGTGVNNLLINIDGGASASGENNSLVIRSAAGGALAANQFVVVNRGATAASGTVRIFTAAVQSPDVNYVNVQVVSPSVATVNGQPNLLIMGPDLNEPNEYQANSAFVGSGATLQVQHASIFPNYQEFPGVPSDEDYYQVVAQTSGTLDFQVYFKLYSALLLPGGGNLNLEVLDFNGNVIAAAPGTFGLVGSTANARVRIPAVAGQSYYLHVFGQLPGEGQSAVVNGYDITVINTANPVPANLELSRSVAAPIAGNPDTGDLPATAPANDTGRSQFDNVTKINNPTIYLRLDDASFLQDIPGNQTAGGVPPMGAIAIPFNASTVISATAAGYRIAVYDGGNGAPAAGNSHTLDANDSTFIGFAQPVAGVPHLYALTIGSQGADSLADGLHYLTARVQIIDPANPTQSGFGDRSTALQIIVDAVAPPVYFGTQASAIDGIDPAQTDTGVQSFPATFVDRVTSDTHTGFWGVAEANAVVRVYSDQNNNGVVDAGDLLLGTTTAIPIDGTNAYPNGQWNLTTTVDLNNPAYFPHDGTRNLLVTAEDLAGNVSTPDALKIFIDTQGPQVFDPDGAGPEQAIQITGSPDYNLFGQKPDNATQGPTPLVNSLTINIVDQPNRDTVNFPNYVALLAEAAQQPGVFVVTGDAVGVVTIKQIIVTNNPTVNGQPATATIELVFASPLPDDRYTLTINDADVVDPAGNKLDGESNTQEPNGTPTFPSGNGTPGGDFVARFTVDSRPEIGTWSAGSVYIDTNGNWVYDPTNVDASNRDLPYTFGYTSDNLFAGNFSPTANSTADGFDKLAAYGRVGMQWRWLVDTDNDGVPDINLVDPAALNALPIAGEFDNNTSNGDEVGLFNGAAWYFDTNHDYQIDLASKVTSLITGYPIVGDFDGDGHVDLGTYRDDMFYFQLWDSGTNSYSTTVRTISTLNFIGVRERPVATDLDQDGITDIGLWVPDRSGATGDHIGEWYFLVSNDPATDTSGNVLAQSRMIGQVNTLDHSFSPTPLGHDIYARMGNEFAMPIVGNFDPPVRVNAGPTIASVVTAITAANPVITWNVADTDGIASTVILVDGKSLPVMGPYGTKFSANYAGNLSNVQLTVGTHSYVIRATDSLGNAAAEYTGTFTVAAKPAVVTNSGPAIASVVTALTAANPVITWNLADADGIASTSISVDGKTLPVYGPYGTKYNANYAGGLATLNLGAGSHSYVIRATDAKGNTAVEYTGTFTVAAKPAVVTNSGPTIASVVTATAAANPVITWNLADADGIASTTILVDGKTLPVYGPYGTKYNANYAGGLAGLNLSAGTHSYVIRATDVLGNVATQCAGSFDVAAKAAVVANSGPTISRVVTALTAAAPVITWNLADADGIASTTILVDGKTLPVYGPYGTKYNANYAGGLSGLNLSAGTHSFVIRATDARGNVATQYSGSFVWGSSLSAARAAVFATVGDDSASAKAAWLYGPE